MKYEPDWPREEKIWPEKEFFTASKSCSSLDLHTLYFEALCVPHWVKGRENMPRTSDVRWKDWILMDVFKANYPYQLFKILTFSFRKVIQDTTWFRFAACCVKKKTLLKGVPLIHYTCTYNSRFQIYSMILKYCRYFIHVNLLQHVIYLQSMYHKNLCQCY